MIRRLLCFLLLAVAELTAGERVRMGDDRFSVEIETPLTGWIATRGPRFDTTAAVVSVRLDGREFLTEGGLADEFNPKWVPPPGYIEANPGDPFLKVGVGVLRRPTSWRYVFVNEYPVIRLADSERFRTADGALGFRQRCDSGLGWGYAYVKTYRVDADERRLTIGYRVRNTGVKDLVIDHYNHNWFRVDAADGEPRLDSPFAISGKNPADGIATEPASHRMAEQAVAAKDNRAVLHGFADGRRVEISGDFDAVRFALFADKNTICPEVFGRWKISPGEEAAWTRTYRFEIENSKTP